MNGSSQLSQIRFTGHDENSTESQPPLEFGYSRFEPNQRDFLALRGSDLSAGSLANTDLELVDLFVNGLPDLIEMNGTIRYWPNLELCYSPVPQCQIKNKCSERGG